MSRLPATMVFAPLGAVGLAIVVNNWARSISRLFMAWHGRVGKSAILGMTVHAVLFRGDMLCNRTSDPRCRIRVYLS